MRYQGSCHCGAIRFSVEGTLGEVLECNCSICRRKGRPMAAINVRCLEDVELAALTRVPFDGRSR